MESIRKIKKIFKSMPTIEGAGVHLKRGFGHSEVPQFDPFLMLDDFHSNNPAHYLPGFPWHPHRGIETITYIFEGRVEHGDSLGNKGVIGPGDLQWMSAGSGIIHQEMPKQSQTGGIWGLQFWANLPAGRKMTAPRYRDVKAADIPEVILDGGVKIKVIAGRVANVQGPVDDIVIDPEMLDVGLAPGAVFERAIPAGHTVFAYIIDGEACFGDTGSAHAHEALSPHTPQPEGCGAETVVLFEPGGDVVQISANDHFARFILVSGRPIGEPIAWQGPIVMNTPEELKTAFEELRFGTFVK
ncbi:MAG: pirin family protein [Syntrophobacteraceae bacterium]